ncbi:hypothetical protein WBG83_14115 [Paenibacillus sp. y28]
MGDIYSDYPCRFFLACNPALPVSDRRGTVKEANHEVIEMNYTFQYNERLGIRLPVLHQEWELIPLDQQSRLLHEWEVVRGAIPDRIKAIEMVIVQKQNQLNVEDNFAVSCRLNYEISEMASVITDLHLWYRVDQDIAEKSHQ